MTRPSWALVAGADQAINPEVQRFAAKRAGALVVELDAASHAVAVSQPKEVADLMRDAVHATSRPDAATAVRANGFRPHGGVPSSALCPRSPPPVGHRDHDDKGRQQQTGDE
ncbi:alpha/beta fold hydrolase [Streptomyces inhibens]|uniref:alpha/beta fold hydrolase n=1 Tax=Streptomyces inhibens TaxID=2293571 RepID=UPI0037BDF290